MRFKLPWLCLLNNLFEISDHIVNLQKAANTANDWDSLQKGIDLIKRSVESTIVKEKVEPINVMAGDSFNPEIHDAFSLMASPKIEKDCILEQINCGYKFENILLRPARVVVSSGK